MKKFKGYLELTRKRNLINEEGLTSTKDEELKQKKLNLDVDGAVDFYKNNSNDLRRVLRDIRNIIYNKDAEGIKDIIGKDWKRSDFISLFKKLITDSTVKGKIIEELKEDPNYEKVIWLGFWAYYLEKDKNFEKHF